jgi:hypothetical protein
LNKNINFVGKGVDKYNPVLPKSMPRGYGGVAIIWKENIDHLIKNTTRWHFDKIQ